MTWDHHRGSISNHSPRPMPRAAGYALGLRQLKWPSPNKAAFAFIHHAAPCPDTMSARSTSHQWISANACPKTWGELGQFVCTLSPSSPPRVGARRRSRVIGLERPAAGISPCGHDQFCHRSRYDEQWISRRPNRRAEIPVEVPHRRTNVSSPKSSNWFASEPNPAFYAAVSYHPRRKL